MSVHTMDAYAEEALYLAKQMCALRRQMAAARALRWAARGGLAGCAAGVALLVASRLMPEWDIPLEVPFVALLVGLAAGVAWGLARPPSLQHAARWADERLSLQDLLSTAAELGGEAGEVPRALVLSAAASLRASPIAQAFPPLLTRPLAGLLAGAGLMVALCLLPDLDYMRSPARRSEVAAMRREGLKLERRAAAIQKRARAWRLPVEQQIAANMRQLGRDLRRGRIGRAQALARLNRLTDQLQREQLAAAREAAGRRASPAEPAEAISAEAAAKLLRASARAPMLTKRASHLSALISQRQADQVANELRDLADAVGDGRMPPSEERRLARDLNQMADALRDCDQDELSRSLQQASERLSAADRNGARQRLNEAAASVAKREMLASMQAAAGG